MLRLICVALFLPWAANAASPSELSRLHAAIQSDVLMQILSDEGMEQAEGLRLDMFPGRSGGSWTLTAREIYAPDRLLGLFREHFDAELEGADVSALLEFYDSETGTRVAELEVAARRAISSDDVEEAARAAYAEIDGSGSEREELLDEFAELNGLVDRNVAGAMNANLAFYRGLSSGGELQMSENDMLREVWDQAADIREDTEGWVYAFMAFAYESLSDEELKTYVDLSATQAGRDLNRALFAGFDALFIDVSYSIGAATAQFSIGDEL